MIGTITAIVGIAVKGSWFAKAEFAPEILGEWEERDNPTGGLVLELEAQTGQTYPELRRMREEALQKYYKFRNALPWNKGSTAKTYHEKVQKFAHAIQAEAEAYQQTLGGIPGLPNILTSVVKSPFVIVALVFLFVIGILLFTMRRRKR
ncbi:hypothetical protein ES702_01930 [subsurface metagenome]